MKLGHPPPEAGAVSPSRASCFVISSLRQPKFLGRRLRGSVPAEGYTISIANAGVSEPSDGAAVQQVVEAAELAAAEVEGRASEAAGHQVAEAAVVAQSQATARPLLAM